MTALISSEPLVVPSGSGPFVDLGDHRGHVKVSAQASNGEFTLIELEVDPNGGVPLHVHSREDETFYILSGRFAVQLGEETVEAGPGATAFGPREIPHAWKCISPEGGRMLIMITPGQNFEMFAIKMAQQGYSPATVKEDPSKLAEFMALAEQFGIRMLPGK